MKRCSSAIVDYGSSSDEESPLEVPPPKKKKLPALSTTLVLPTPVDNPALHQGRIRSTPHVDGNWAAHVYASITVDRSHAMYALLKAAIADAQRELPALRTLIYGKDQGDDCTPRCELHISLSRPIFIRAHQKEELRRAVKALARRSPFTLSFTSFAELQNDERTRTFLTLEIGAGHRELKRLCGNLEPLLLSLRQPSYYSTPRFHSSIAWALLDRARNPSEAEGKLTAEDSLLSPIALPDTDARSASSTEPSTPAQFATVPGIPEKLVHKLNDEFGKRLCSPHVGLFEVKNISLKIGKDRVSWPLIE